MRFSPKEVHYWPLSTCTISKKTNEQFSRKSRKAPFWPHFDHFLPKISRTRILPDMRFSPKEAHYWPWGGGCHSIKFQISKSMFPRLQQYKKNILQCDHGCQHRLHFKRLPWVFLACFLTGIGSTNYRNLFLSRDYHDHDHVVRAASTDRYTRLNS